jgi:hypothetical protein
MTDGDGKPVRRRYPGEIYRQKLGEGDDATVIAKRLTLAIWRGTGRGCVRRLQSAAALSRFRCGVAQIITCRGKMGVRR